MMLEQFKVGDVVMKYGHYGVSTAKILNFTKMHVIVLNSLGKREFWFPHAEVIPFDKEKWDRANELYKVRDLSHATLTKQIQEVLK